MKAPIDGVRDAISQHMPSYDAEVAEVILATIVANRLDGPPTWLMLIAPPSSGKTIALEPLEVLPDTKLLSKLTPQTLLSGMPDQNGKPASLLLQLGSKPTIVVKDLGTLLESNHAGKGEIYAQLREVYDGYISSAYGNGRFVEWPGKGKRGKATLIVGMTPSIDMYHLMESHLGERFLRFQYRSTQPRRQITIASLDGTGGEDRVMKALEDAYHQTYRLVTMRLARGGPYAGPKTKALVVELAMMTAQGRTSVIRNPYEGNAIMLTPESEATPRVAKMLWTLAQALCILRGEEELSDPSLLRRIAIDNIRNPRRQFIQRMIELTKQNEFLTIPDLVEEMGLTRQTVARHIEDLVVTDVLEEVPSNEAPSHDSPGRPPKYYRFDKEFEKLLKAAKYL